MAIYFSPHAATGAGAMGESIGKSLAQTLNMLTQRKMKQQERRQRQGEISEGLQSLGVPSEMAQGVSALPEAQQALFMKQLLGSEAFGAPQQQAGLEQMIGGGQQQQQPVEQQQGLGQLLGGQQQQQVPGQQQPQVVGQGADADFAAAQQQGQQQPNEEQQKFMEMQSAIQKHVDQMTPEQKKTFQDATQRGIKSGKLPGVDRSAPQAIDREVASTHLGDLQKDVDSASRIQKIPTRKKTFRELLSTPRMTKKDRSAAIKIAQKQQEIDYSRQRQIDKTTEPFFSKTMKDGSDATENMMRLKALESLNEEGDLNDPLTIGLVNLLKKTGFDLTSQLITQDSQLFQKIAADFIKTAATYMQGRFSVSALREFQKTIPSLSMSKEGRRAVIKNMKLLTKIPIYKEKAMHSAIRENGYNRPNALGTIVKTRVASQIADISRKYIDKDNRIHRARVRGQRNIARKGAKLGSAWKSREEKQGAKFLGIPF